jgi:hypothetical protein
MQFLKKNYEKVVLAVVVLVALGVVACLPILVSQEKQKLDELLQSYFPKHPKPLPPLDLQPYQAFLNRAQTSVGLDMSQTNKLFNPVRWLKAVDQHIFPSPAGTEIQMLEVVKTSPLYFDITFDTVSAAQGLTTRYVVGIQHEAGLLQRDRARKPIYASLNQATNGFTIVSFEGQEDDPTSLTLELADTGERITITKDHPYKRIEGYTIDLQYPPEKHTFPPNRHVGDTISFGGEYYKIIDIKESEVVLLQQSNQKQWIKKFSPTNASSTAPPP